MRSISRLKTAASAAILGLGLTGQALAHAHLTSAVPAENGTVATVPTELDLKFSEELNLKFTGVKVTGPDKKAVATGAASLASGDETGLVVPISATLAPGKYIVAWHALSKDGHKTHGTYSFTVKP
ncbi:copper homeostasis periplasmic binding protein CopC [Labrys wisconsinensis]|uniref:Methionine-rich copper-binding protein CopC n=1 Tax=Labrys wisconsinensis TaxID=425677 RepID=A0ABU0JLB4_9HYPH|nr:copper homeostasis periplasmic binding protein CopC [Labrys wisconsinensis]MDQ0475086.1 methionine-rich copper-binding protein CopC [Labrys wisconsinensis]